MKNTCRKVDARVYFSKIFLKFKFKDSIFQRKTLFAEQKL